METVRGNIEEATSKYRRMKVETSDQLSLIMLLYDRLVRLLKDALSKLKEGRIAHRDCIKARDIVYHLLCTLKDDGSEIAKNLKSLYFYTYKQIVLADMERSASRIEKILPVVKEIRSAWAELRRSERNRNDER